MKEHDRGEIILEHLNIQESSKCNDCHNSPTNDNDYKTCPQCGQGLFPFKYGLCTCGKQVGFRTFLVSKDDYPFGLS